MKKILFLLLGVVPALAAMGKTNQATTPVNDSRRSPYIIYWDAASGTMQVGAWNNGSGGDVTQANMLFFRFGSTIGFLNQNDTFDASDIKFNLISDTNYTELNNWTDWFGSGLTGAPLSPAHYTPGTHGVDGYISSANYHYAANVQAGRGDPCKLVGLTKAQIQAGKIDNGLFRLPTLVEQQSVNWALSGNFLDASAGVKNPAGEFLPTAGALNTDGSKNDLDPTRGSFWVGRPYNNKEGYDLFFNWDGIDASDQGNANAGYGVRCMRADKPYYIPSPSGEVEVGGLVWARNNVAERGEFATSPYLYDRLSSGVRQHQYSWDRVTEYDYCPEGWRLPTLAEYKALYAASTYEFKTITGPEGNVNGGEFTIEATGDKLFFAASGYNASNLKGSQGAYWSSSYIGSAPSGSTNAPTSSKDWFTPRVDSEDAYRLGFDSSYASPEGRSRRLATMSIRCVRDE